MQPRLRVLTPAFCAPEVLEFTLGYNARAFAVVGAQVERWVQWQCWPRDPDESRRRAKGAVVRAGARWCEAGHDCGVVPGVRGLLALSLWEEGEFALGLDPDDCIVNVGGVSAALAVAATPGVGIVALNARGGFGGMKPDVFHWRESHVAGVRVLETDRAQAMTVALWRVDVMADAIRWWTDARHWAGGFEDALWRVCERRGLRVLMLPDYRVARCDALGGPAIDADYCAWKLAQRNRATTLSFGEWLAARAVGVSDGAVAL